MSGRTPGKIHNFRGNPKTIGLHAGYFFNAVLMAAAFKRSGHKYLYHFFSIAFPYKPGWYTDNIGVIMFSYQLGNLFAPANGSTDMLMFVGSNGYSVGCTA